MAVWYHRNYILPLDLFHLLKLEKKIRLIKLFLKFFLALREVISVKHFANILHRPGVPNEYLFSLSKIMVGLFSFKDFLSKMFSQRQAV